MKDLVAGLDSSTTATKAIAWSGDGCAVAEGRCSIPLANPADRQYEQDPCDWWRSACAALRQLTQKLDASRIAAIAISNQRETFVPLDAGGRAVRPAIVWLDQRCEREVEWLAARIGAERIHSITGKPADMAPVAYRIAWLLRNERANFDKTAIFADVHAYLAWHLTGRFRTSRASADPLGLFDMQRNEWSAEVLCALELTPDRLPEACAPCSVIGEITSEAAEATGLAPGTLVVAGGGDGQAAGLGVNALASERAYLNLGTAVVGGIYSSEYLTDTAWRTMGSCSGEGCYLESSLRTGTFLVDWFMREMWGVDTSSDPGIYSRLEKEAAGSPVGSRGLLLLPYWGAVMTPYWDPRARGVIAGLTSAHTRADVYRALLEGIALEQALVTSLAEERAGVNVREFVVIGGGAASELWRRILADVSGKTVLRSQTVEASSLGAAVCAATGAGWFASAREAAAAMAGAITSEMEPKPGAAARYRELFAIYREVYPATREIGRRLSRFAEK